MVRLYITRHGETVWNTQKRMQGHKDSPLTEKGIHQAEQLARKLADIQLDAVYASSSGRTIQTARILAGDRKTPVIPLDELREISLGEWEGRTFEEVEAENPEQYRNFWECPHRYEPSGGEGFPDIRRRIGEILSTLVSRHDGGNLLVVTHAVALKTIMAIVENKDWKDLWTGAFIHPTSLSELEYENGVWKAVKWGDISHYEE